MLELIRSRHCFITPDKPTAELPSCSFVHLHNQMSAFQLDKLEEDLVSTFIAGKPKIEAPAQLRRVVEFKKNQDIPLQ